MPQPRTLILRAPGTNCDGETAHAFSLAGGRAELLHVNRLLERPDALKEYQVFCLPGGFSFGDDIASGRILASRLRRHLAEPLARFREAGKLILGICNGFQILIQSGLLVDDDPQLGPPATLAWNASGRFEDRWVRLAVGGSKCVFLAGIESLYLPVAHGEGRFMSDANPQQLESNGKRPDSLKLTPRRSPPKSGRPGAVSRQSEWRDGRRGRRLRSVGPEARPSCRIRDQLQRSDAATLTRGDRGHARGRISASSPTQ